MKVTDYIISKIERLPRGYVFTYDDFITEVDQKEAIIKSLNRLADSNKIEKLSKGRFYKPEKTPFGNLQPSEYQVAKDLLEKNGKLIGYLSGYGIYNSLGLTTQISNTIQIGRNEVRPAMKRGQFRISFIKQKNTITKENIPLLQILDAIRFIKDIPDATMAFLCQRFIAIIKELSLKDKKTLSRLTLKYPPASRALVGAFMEEVGDKKLTESLAKSLNPITVYKLGVSSEMVSSKENWNLL